jgi:hypothetical protein
MVIYPNIITPPEVIKMKGMSNHNYMPFCFVIFEDGKTTVSYWSNITKRWVGSGFPNPFDNTKKKNFHWFSLEELSTDDLSSEHWKSNYNLPTKSGDYLCINIASGVPFMGRFDEPSGMMISPETDLEVVSKKYIWVDVDFFKKKI